MTPGIVGPLHELRPLAMISPSRLTAMQACPLRAVWSAAHCAPLLPAPPAARLGSLAHQLLEEAGRGQFKHADPEEIERRWDELVVTSEEAMATSWLDHHLVPLRLAVADYEVRKLRALAAARMLVAQSTGIRPTDDADDAAVLGFEVPVTTRDGAVGGRIDAVIRADDGLVIRDYKSGPIYEAQEVGNRIVKDEFVLQLRLYAAIYASMTGRWPSRIEIVPLAGEPVNIPFTAAECMQLLEEAVRLRDEINKIVNMRTPLASRLDRLASPAPATCAHCDYRPQCAPYTRTLQVRVSAVWPCDITGYLTELLVLGNGRRALALTKDDETSRIRGIDSSQERHPALNIAIPGDTIGAFNLRPGGGANSFTEGPFTVFYKLGPPPLTGG